MSAVDRSVWALIASLTPLNFIGIDSAVLGRVGVFESKFKQDVNSDFERHNKNIAIAKWASLGAVLVGSVSAALGVRRVGLPITTVGAVIAIQLAIISALMSLVSFNYSA